MDRMSRVQERWDSMAINVTPAVGPPILAWAEAARWHSGPEHAPHPPKVWVYAVEA